MSKRFMAIHNLTCTACNITAIGYPNLIDWLKAIHLVKLMKSSEFKNSIIAATVLLFLSPSAIFASGAQGMGSMLSVFLSLVTILVIATTERTGPNRPVKVDRLYTPRSGRLPPPFS